MDIFLDSNIIIADLWLRSQNMRLLADFVRKTQSRLLLHEIVVAEVESKVKRSIREHISNVEKALTDASKNSLSNLPSLDANKIYEETFRNWQFAFRCMFALDLTTVIKLDNSSLPEAIRRSVEKIKPCSEKGEEIRDTLIWLNALAYAKKRGVKRQYVFISSNTNEFAEADKKSLHPILQDDVNKYDLNLAYFTNLDSFVKVHAQPVVDISYNWIQDHIDSNEVVDLVRSYLIWRGSTLFRPSIKGYSGRYQIVGKPNVTYLDAIFEGFIVWQLSNQHIELRISFRTTSTAEVELRRMDGQLSFFDLNEDDEEEMQKDAVYTVNTSAEFICDISARVANKELLLIDIEDVHRL